MNQKIKILPPNEALKIAAGEVIERPAHVIKELIENSLDAQASAVDIHIKDVGKTLIRIVDNGVGMSPEDARICFLPHATSKISSIHDLESISSFGFRGEALASISAISNVTLITKNKDSSDDDLGIKLVYSEQQLKEQAPIACPVGTDINIHDLFFNTPVRKKFLKSDDTEWNAIASVVYAFCFSYSNVHFRLYNNDRLVLNAPATKTQKDRACQVWDVATAQELIELNSIKTESVSIEGLISHHNFWRYGRQYIHFFVNGRWVKNVDLSKSLLKGYLNVLPHNRFPAALIFITVEPSLVDVNIHPKKEEVKFLKPGSVYTPLTMQVKKTLEAYLSSKISTYDNSLHMQSETKSLPGFIPHSDESPPILGTQTPDTENNHTHDQYTHGDSTFSLDKGEVYVADQKPFQYLNQEPPNFFRHSTVAGHVPTRKIEHQHQVVGENRIKILGQAFNTYILVEQKNEIVFIDQHAAHERILYEKYRKSFNEQHGVTLMFPETVVIEKHLMQGLIEHKEFFSSQGIMLDEIGEQKIVVRTSPPQLKGPSLNELISQAAHFIHEHHHLDVSIFKTKFNEHLHAQMACKGAVKAGDILTLEQMQKLLADLDSVENRFICAHGRPTTWSVSQLTLEKHFRRC